VCVCFMAAGQAAGWVHCFVAAGQALSCNHKLCAPPHRTRTGCLLHQDRRRWRLEDEGETPVLCVRYGVPQPSASAMHPCTHPCPRSLGMRGTVVPAQLRLVPAHPNWLPVLPPPQPALHAGRAAAPRHCCPTPVLAGHRGQACMAWLLRAGGCACVCCCCLRCPRCCHAHAWDVHACGGVCARVCLRTPPRPPTSYTLISTGMTSPTILLVAALYSLQKAMMLTPCGGRAPRRRKVARDVSNGRPVAELLGARHTPTHLATQGRPHWRRGIGLRVCVCACVPSAMWAGQ